MQRHVDEREGDRGQDGGDGKAVPPFEPGLDETGPRGLFPQVDEQEIDEEPEGLGDRERYDIDRCQVVTEQEGQGHGQRGQSRDHDQPPAGSDAPAEHPAHQPEDTGSAVDSPGHHECCGQKGQEDQHRRGDALGVQPR